MSRNKTILALCLAGCVFLTSCRVGDPKQSLLPKTMTVPEQVNYLTAQVQSGDYTKTRQGSASAAYPVVSELSVDAANLRLKEFLVRRNDEVSKGDVLCTFEIIEDPVELETRRLRLTRAKEAYEAGKASRLLALEQARSESSGVRQEDPLAAHTAQIAQLSIDKLQVEYEQFVYQSEREIAALQVRLDELEHGAETLQLTAPFDGYVRQLGTFSSGQQIKPGELIVSVYSTEFFLLKVSNVGDTIRYNMQIELEAGPKNNRRTYLGRVVSSGNILPRGVEQDYVLIRAEPALAELERKYIDAVQYSCNAQELQDVLLVDNRAIQDEGKKSFVYVLEDGKLHKRYVTAGFHNPDVTWVLDGLQEGQTLILG